MDLPLSSYCLEPGRLDQKGRRLIAGVVIGVKAFQGVMLRLGIFNSFHVLIMEEEEAVFGKFIRPPEAPHPGTFHLRLSLD